MGQYHTLICPRAGMTIYGGDICGGVKAVEHIWNPGTAAALAFLSVAGTGEHPRDLPWAPKGAWAGYEPLMIGDYAEEGDLQGRDAILPADEEALYEHAGAKIGRLNSRPRKAKASRELSHAFLPILERVWGTRFSDMAITGVSDDSYREAVNVRPSDTHPSGWEMSFEGLTVDEQASMMEFYERIGLLESDTWRRAALPLRLSGSQSSAEPESVPSAEEAGEGSALLWVNLDRGEFVDPRSCGDTPDLVGVMDGSSAKGVLGMLFHHRARGGGDLPDTGPLHLAGRWRGDRIVLMGAGGFKPKKGSKVFPDQVIKEFEDVSDLARAFVSPEEHFGVERMDSDGSPTQVTSPDSVETRILGAIAAAPEVRRRTEMAGIDGLKGITVRLVPPSKIDTQVDGVSLVLPASVDVYADGISGGKIWLPLETHKRIAALAKTLPAVQISLEKNGEDVCIDAGSIRLIDLSALSNHTLIETLAA